MRKIFKSFLHRDGSTVIRVSLNLAMERRRSCLLSGLDNLSFAAILDHHALFATGADPGEVAETAADQFLQNPYTLCA